MDQATMDKLIEMIKGDILGVSISKKVDRVFTGITFRYDKEKDEVSYESDIYNDTTKERKVKNGIITNADQIANMLAALGLESVAIETVQSRIAKESKYLSAKQSMVDKLKNIDLLPEEKAIILEVIDTTCQLGDVVGMGNRVTLNSTPDFYEHVRLADQSRWSDTGGKLHLQLVQTVEDSSGTKHKNYPFLEFDELVGRILDSEYFKNKVKNSKKM